MTEHFAEKDQIRELVEQSSLGTPEAVEKRASVSDEHAARIVALARELDAAEQIACTCAASLIETNSHEDTCAVNEARWDDPEYLATQSPREVWDASVAPGGYVCSECGMPTESEPCAEHGPHAGPSCPEQRSRLVIRPSTTGGDQ